MQSGFLVFDDIIDGSSMRRGRTPWGLLQQAEGYGFIGINDGLYLFLSAYQILMAALYPSSHPRCLDILKHFSNCAYNTCIGQGLDILSENQLKSNKTERGSEASKLDYDRLKRVNVSVFTSIAKWKTSFYSFVLPVVSGMLIVNFIIIALFYVLYIGGCEKFGSTFKCGINSSQNWRILPGPSNLTSLNCTKFQTRYLVINSILRYLHRMTFWTSTEIKS